MTATRFDFALIGQWWHLPLESEVSIARSAKRLAESAGGRHDAFTQVRSELREQLTRTARRARAEGGSDLYLARQLVPDVVIPATLTVYWPDVPREKPDPAGAGGADGTEESVASADDLTGETARFAASLRATDGREIDAPALVGGWGVARATGTRAERLEVGEVATDLFGASYWLLGPGSFPVVLMDFTSPHVGLRGPLLEVFDAIVSSVSLRDPAPAVD